MLFYTLFCHMVLLRGVLLMGSTSKLVLVSQKKVVRAMTFSDPFAHSLPLLFDFQICKFDDINHLYVSSFIYECHNNLAPNHFSDYFTQVSDIHHHNTRSASHSAFFLKERTLYKMVYALFVLMEQKFGITSFLISETLHQLETSRKRSNNYSWSHITKKLDYVCSVW